MHARCWFRALLLCSSDFWVPLLVIFDFSTPLVDWTTIALIKKKNHHRAQGLTGGLDTAWFVPLTLGPGQRGKPGRISACGQTNTTHTLDWAQIGNLCFYGKQDICIAACVTYQQSKERKNWFLANQPWWLYHDKCSSEMVSLTVRR